MLSEDGRAFYTLGARMPIGTQRLLSYISEPQTKRQRSEPQKHFYPSVGSSKEDKQSFERNQTLLRREMESKKPNSEAVKSLMVRTFAVRRKKILSGSQMVMTLCREYPFLKKAMFVSYL